MTASYLAEEADVEDAVQDTFLRALGGIAGYEPRRPFAPWLYQIARNVSRNRLATRKRQRTEPLGDIGLEAPTANPEVDLERAELRGIVERAIDLLPEQQRTAFRLTEVDGFATDEVARIMDLSAGTVRSHVHHARRALREALAQAGRADGMTKEWDE